MNKNLKKIVAIALAFSAFSAIAPATNNNLLTTKAYASSDDDENDKSLDRLSLETSGGKSIQLYDDQDCKSGDKIDDKDVSDDGKYYAKTSSSKISISISGVKTKYVRVFTGTSKSTKGKKISNDISLSSGTNTIVVKVYSEEPDSNVKYSDDSLYEYTLKVKYTGSDSSSSDDDDDDNSQDSIYLSSLTLSEGNIDFSKKTSSYNVTVGSSVDEITIKAKPDNEDDYTVTIDGTEVDEGDKWKKDVSLEKGKNKIKIEVEDDDDNKRTYTLNITRGTSSSTNDSTSSTSDKIFLDSLSIGATSLKLSEDVSAYNLKVKSSVEKIQLKAEPKNDDYTVTIDGTTVDDGDDYKKNVSLDEDKVNTFKIKVKNASGTEKVYTLNIGRGDVDASKFPSINSSNTTTNNNTTNNNTQTNTNTTVKANQWVEVSGGQWQYNDATGNPIKNQWFYDRNAGKTYYLQADGTMATGWLQLQGTWYYLNPVSDGTRGAKMTGWQNVGGTWYYMDSEGKMLSNTTVDGYKLAANGAWIR